MSKSKAVDVIANFEREVFASAYAAGFMESRNHGGKLLPLKTIRKMGKAESFVCFPKDPEDPRYGPAR